MDRTPVLQVGQLRYRWPGQRSDIVQLQDLSLGAGERMLVHGDSGSGKSTLFSLAAGVLLPTEGLVSLMGQSWQDLSAASRER